MEEAAAIYRTGIKNMMRKAYFRVHSSQNATLAGAEQYHNILVVNIQYTSP